VSIRVLLADDHEATHEQVARVLGPDRPVVAVASDGQSALELAASVAPDLVVLDISMPLMDGIQVARRLLADDPGARIVFLTASEQPELAQVCLELGAVGYVIKARMAHDLPMAVEQVMAGHSFASPPFC
jgi:DNA-binding NarL/FixJ family response regulator